MTIDDVLNRLLYDVRMDRKTEGLVKAKLALLEIIKGTNPKIKCKHTVSRQYERGYICRECERFNQGADEYEKKIEGLFK